MLGNSGMMIPILNHRGWNLSQKGFQPRMMCLLNPPIEPQCLFTPSCLAEGGADDPSGKMTGLQHRGLSRGWGEELFFKGLRYRKVSATIEFRTKGNPCITFRGAEEDFIDRVPDKMDLKRERENSHVDQRGVPCFRERKQQHNISGQLQKVQGTLINKGYSIGGFHDPSD